MDKNTTFKYWLADFNSIKVRLEHAVGFAFLPCIINFNSIKVRLEQQARAVDVVMLIFQFHKGAIRTFLYNYLSSG